MNSREVKVEQGIEFIDLNVQRERIAERVDDAIKRVLQHGKFIMGPEVAELEAKLAEFCGSKHVVTCANGTDALSLVLMSKGVGPGDAVFVPAFTFVAAAEAVALLGATPVFVDVSIDTFNMDVNSLSDAIVEAQNLGLNPKIVIPVDLFGQPADYESIGIVAEKNNLCVIADAAQSFGARLGDKKVGTMAAATTTSFFPAKPLGCYGDGGAVITDDDELVEILRSLRTHGGGRHKYENVRIGTNSRLDTIQAAILLPKLEIFADEIEARNRIATRYSALLEGVANVPIVLDRMLSVWAQYTLRIPKNRRAHVMNVLEGRGIPSAVYYPVSTNRQPGYRDFPTASHGVPNSEQLVDEVLSIPMHPYLSEESQDRVVAALQEALRG